MKPKTELESRGEETLPVIFHASKAKHGFGLLASLAFVLAGGVLVTGSGQAVLTGWLALLFFGLCAVVFGINLLPRSSYLLLEPEGFTVRSLFRDHFTPWSEVGEFHAGFVGTTTMVLYDMPGKASPSSANLPAVRGLSKALSGYHGALPDTYGWSAQDLVALMNLWRETVDKTTPEIEAETIED